MCALIGQHMTKVAVYVCTCMQLFACSTHTQHIYRSVFEVGLHVWTWKNTPSLWEGVPLYMHVPFTKQGPLLAPSPPPFPWAHSIICLLPFGIWQLRAGVPLLGNNTPPSPHLCLIRGLQVPTHKWQPMIAMDEFLNCPWCLRVQCKHNGSY